MKTQQEIERKYEVDESAIVPSLADIARVEPHGEARLEAEYFDTEDGDLAAHRIVLRRRVGGADEGWHIKIPAEEGRTELHWPLTDGDVPTEVRQPVLVHVRDRKLSVIARVETHRTMLHLLDEEGNGLLELADDIVSASDSSTGVLRVWREWEAELLAGAPKSAAERAMLLDAVEERLLAAGGTPASSVSKLASALGRTSLANDAPQRLSLDRSSPVSEVLLVAVSHLVDDIKRIDPAARTGQPDAVHQLRTRTRRLRSLFASYRAVFDRTVTGPIRDELQHLGTVLGEARDAEVMRDRAAGLLADHDSFGPALEKHLVGKWSATHDSAQQRVGEELSGVRYFRLLDSLDDFVARPALAKTAFDQAGEHVPAVMQKDLKRVLRHAKAADAAASEADRIGLLHDTRKAAKRLRYAAEAVSAGDAAVFGKKLRRLAAVAESVHDLLGEHRDSVLMQAYLSDNRRSVHAFDYGVLHEVERHGAARCLAEYPAALADLRAFR